MSPRIGPSGTGRPTAPSVSSVPRNSLSLGTIGRTAMDAHYWRGAARPNPGNSCDETFHPVPGVAILALVALWGWRDTLFREEVRIGKLWNPLMGRSL